MSRCGHLQPGLVEICLMHPLDVVKTSRGRNVGLRMEGAMRCGEGGRDGSRWFSRERQWDRSYSFSLTWKPPSYMVHGLVSAHLEVTKGVGRHFLQGAVRSGHPI
ncbi:hypothetical protein NQZ68_034784 [Dissostichus eleginoides]|nr:hypothetical protein NQZ68_034784 [Dissostichus eleginoides]